MLKTIKYISLFLILATIVFTLSTCKKYPENTLWFKNINKIKFFDSKLTSYKVNGVDSLQELNKYFGSNATIKNIKGTLFSSVRPNDTKDQTAVFVVGYGGGTDGIEIYYKYLNQKKEISFVYGKNGIFDTTAFKINIFINPDPWQIIKFEPKGIKKIKKTVNGNTYELQFDPN